MLLQQQLGEVQQKLLHVLLALNHEYYFGFKWLDLVLTKLMLAPADFTIRFKAVNRLPPQAAAASLAQLVEKTYDLVEQHAPAVYVNRFRSIFR